MTPIEKYFNGERGESYLFMLMGVLAFAVALYFIFGLKTSFWKGVAIPFLLVATLELIVGFTIVNRSPKDIQRVETYLQTAPEKLRTEELPRMETVMRNFVTYRFVEIGLIILGIVLMYSSQNDTFWRGLGLGLFLQASIVLSLDFFAERRGHTYMNYLQEEVKRL